VVAATTMAVDMDKGSNGIEFTITKQHYRL
jgi:hypothetical protein